MSGTGEGNNSETQVFAKFFDVFAQFFDVFGPVRTCFYAFGYIRIHSDAFGKKNSQFFFFRKFREVFRCFCPFSEELRIFGRHQQLPRHFLLQIDLFGARYDPWSSSWDGVPSWDGLRERHWPAPGRLCTGGGGRLCTEGVSPISRQILNGKESK